MTKPPQSVEALVKEAHENCDTAFSLALNYTHRLGSLDSDIAKAHASISTIAEHARALEGKLQRAFQKIDLVTEEQGRKHRQARMYAEQVAALEAKLVEAHARNCHCGGSILMNPADMARQFNAGKAPNEIADPRCLALRSSREGGEPPERDELARTLRLLQANADQKAWEHEWMGWLAVADYVIARITSGGWKEPEES